MEPTREVDLAGYLIPKGTFLMLVNRFGSFQEKNFTQAFAFKPERWLESNSTGCIHNRYASAPFGAGPRFCPGRTLALQEIKMAIAMLCKNFSFSRAETEQTVKERFAFTMMPDKVMIKLTTR
jgi:cytochrome P450